MKTLTMRVDDTTYNVIKNVAHSQKRNIANFMEYAMLQYIETSQFVEDDEMQQILNDDQLVQALKNGREEFDNKEYSIVQ